ncbi:MAG: helix-turn-helix domain-containing protein [Phocaeicola sp.]
MEEKINQILEYSLLAAKKVLNLNDLALFTGLSKSCLYRLTCTQQIPHYKQGKQLFFNREEIEQWLMSNPIKPISTNANVGG